MNPALLRKIRIGAILGCCVLGGIYAGRWFFATESEPAVGPPAALAEQLPDFELVDLAGNSRNIREWLGQPLLINFWATWCAPCRREMPLLQQLHDESPADLSVIGIAIDRLPEVESYIAESGISYPILVGQNTAITAAESFGPEFVALPFSILVAADGTVLGLETGELELEELRGLVRLLERVVAGEISPKAARAAFPGS